MTAIVPFGNSYKQVFQYQFQLLNFAFDLFRRFAKSQFLQLGDPQARHAIGVLLARRLNQLIMDP